MEIKKERVERLSKKLEHWAEHNKEHAESFRKAAKEAEENGFEDVCKYLKEAARSMEESTSHLLAVINKLGKIEKKEKRSV